MTWLRAVLACVCVVICAPHSDACVCPDSGGMESDFDISDAVFAGRVIALEIIHPVGSVAAADDEWMVATLVVERRWKGTPSKTMRVATCGTQDSVCTCGTQFLLGSRYVVFARRDRYFGRVLTTGSCSPTTEIASSRIKGHPELDWVGVQTLVEELDSLVSRRIRAKGR